MSRRAPLVALILGLITLGFFLALGAQPAVSGVYDRTEVSGEVSKFQRAETPADIAAVFGSPADPAKLAAMDALNTVDLWGFIPAYALFLCAGAFMLGGRGVWLWAAIAFALVGAAADVVETWKQLQLTANLDNVAAHLPIAPWHWAKYAGLGLNGIAVAVLCLAGAQKRWIIGVIALAPLPLVAAAYVEVLSTRIFAGAFAAYWIGLLVVAGLEVFRKRA